MQQPVAVLTQQLIKHTNFVGSLFVGQAKKNDARVRASFAKDFFSKTSIIGNQDASFSLCNLKDPIVVSSARLIIN